MGKKEDKERYARLVSIANNHSNNNKCAECGAGYPTWASYNLGILLCGRCSSVHKRVLGPPNQNISKVKSLTLDKWSDSQIDNLSKIGNKRSNRRWNPKRVPFPFDADEDVGAVEQYLRDKYILGRFRDDNIDPSEYDDRLSKFSEEDTGYHSLRPLLRLRSSSVRSQTTIPRLTHRKLTTFEYTQHSSQALKIRLYGYTDRDAVLESLLLSNGNIDGALDILELDAKINPTKEETAPLLPRRPQQTSQPSQSSFTPTSTANASASVSAPNLTDDWWNGSTNSVGAIAQQQPQPQATGMPQIYQYTDPVTGQISYIDSNGQEYLDPNNPQHQQQLMQMNNPQLIAQQTNKQNIMSLYNQPTGQQQMQQQPLQQQQMQTFLQQQQQQQQQQPQFTNVGYVQPQQPQFTGFNQQAGFGQQQQGGYWRPQ
ncbi:MAG: ADP-ribosylation factor GTPase-activating family protein [Asgard group archaeon]|nr:ADP-ribosylation factor GTPase-activating family protein [Asgard group archaeon]